MCRDDRQEHASVGTGLAKAQLFEDACDLIERHALEMHTREWIAMALDLHTCGVFNADVSAAHRSLCHLL